MDPSQQTPNNPPDAPDQDTMAEIRRRRLAKLGTATQPKPDSSSSSSTPPTTTGTSTTPTPTTLPAPSSATATPSSNNIQNPFEKLRDDSNSGAGSPGRTADAAAEMAQSTGSDRALRKRFASEIDDNDVLPAASGTVASTTTTTTTPITITPINRQQQPKRLQPAAEEPFEDWTDKTLSQIFKVTVNPQYSPPQTGTKLVFLDGISQDLQDAQEPLKLTIGSLDAIILEAASQYPHDKPLLNFLWGCWKRTLRASELIKSTDKQKKEVIDEVRRLCLANCLFSLSMPDLFGRQPRADHDTLVPLLLGQLDKGDELHRSRRAVFEFLKDSVDKFQEDDEYATIFSNAIVSISDTLSGKSMVDDYKPYMDALTLYTNFPPLLVAVAAHPRFRMAVSAHNIEKHTILGPFFRLSPLQGSVIRRDFPSARSLEQNQIQIAQESLRLQVRAHQKELWTITNAFIRADIKTRNHVLDWFAYILNVNHKRRAIQVDPRVLSSDGFMLNVTVVLDLLCVPFMDNSFSKVGRIEVEYFRRNPRLDIKEETKLNADQTESQEFLAQTVPGSSNFISEIFFLTLASHHYGSEAANAQITNLDRDLKYMNKRIKMMENERAKFANSPVQLALFENTLKRHVDVLEKTMALKFAIEGMLMDPEMQARSVLFMRYVAVWLLRLASRSDYIPTKTVQLPLPSPGPKEFFCLPEYALQNIVDNFKFIFRYMPQVLNLAIGDELISLCIVFLQSSDYIKNPYLKSSLVSLLYYGTMAWGHHKKGLLGDQLISMKFANEHLLHALIQFYIECENTGAHTQFFDKFNIRYEIFQVIKCVWVNDAYKVQLTEESKVNTSFFIRFVNLLLNDATFVLDEALSKFPVIHTLEQQLARQDLSQEDRAKKEEEMQTLEGQATSYMQLANETLAMMKLFTKALTGAFSMREIVYRLASMLNYNVETLAGPKAGRLRVDKKKEYHFRPINLLSDFIEIYLNLGSSQTFIDAVAADGRAFNPAVFERTGTILAKRSTRDAADLQEWTRLQAKFIQAKELLEQAEADMGEIPSEFEDPIMGHLMVDPVMLPSKTIVDRSTIIQHLLSDPKDPYTRQPMTEDDVVPVDDLKEKIELWKAEKLAEAKARLEANAMDTGE